MRFQNQKQAAVPEQNIKKLKEIFTLKASLWFDRSGWNYLLWPWRR